MRIERKLAIQILEAYVRGAERQLGPFKERLEENPAYAFEWSDSAFRAAAEKEVFEKFLEAMTYNELEETDEEKVERLLGHAEREMRIHLEPKRSSSFAANEMGHERGKALRSVVELLEGSRR